MVGVYLVFTSLIVPAVATYRIAGRRQLIIGYLLGFASYVAGLALSVVTDLPSSSVIVWAMAILGLCRALVRTRQGKRARGKARMPAVAGVAQLVEQWFCKPQVGGSTPSAGTTQ